MPDISFEFSKPSHKHKHSKHAKGTRDETKILDGAKKQNGREKETYEIVEKKYF